MLHRVFSVALGLCAAVWLFSFAAIPFGPLASQAFAQNAGIGHGWVEGGPLLPVKAEFYQSGLGVEALRALSSCGQRQERIRGSRAKRFFL